MVGFIYVLRVANKAGDTLVKIGYASNLENRISAYISYNPLTEVLDTMKLENAEQFEKVFHSRHLAETRYEWYSEDILSVFYTDLENFKLNSSEYCKKTIEFQSLSFKEIIKMCETDETFFKDYTDINRDIKDLIEVVGYDQIKKLDYHVNNVKNFYNKIINKIKIKQLESYFSTNKIFQIGNFYTYPQIKQIMTDLFNAYKISNKPTVSTIKEFYKVRATSKKILDCNGVKTDKIDGFVILK